MNKYRTHTCSELTIESRGKDVVLSGWINKKRDHGNLLFIDLRDNYGNKKRNNNYRIYRTWGDGAQHGRPHPERGL